MRTVDEFQQFALAFNLDRPNWTVKYQIGVNHSDKTTLTHRPYKMFMIQNVTEIYDFTSEMKEYSLSRNHIMKHGSEQQKRNLLCFGCYIVYKTDRDGPYGSFRLASHKGRNEDIRRVVKSAKQIKK
jgi:hypothetical protein